MTVDLVLVNAKAQLENEIIDCSLAIDHGRIFKIGKEANMPKSAKKMDLGNLLVLPGLIDAHVHLRDEGKAYKEDFYTGTAAAAVGGFTTVLDMPNNDPVTMSAKALRDRMRIAEKEVLVNVAFYSEFPRDMKDIWEIIKEGAVAFKLFMAEQVGGLDINDDNALLETFKILKRLETVVAVHAEDRTSLKKTEEELKHSGYCDVDAFLKAHSESVEVNAIKRLLSVAKQAKTHVHFCHLSTERGLGAIRDAKEMMIPITCEATPHNLLLSVHDLKKTGMMAITMPPVREKHHMVALWKGIRHGWIDILASDHAPHTLGEKKARSVWDVKVGIPGLETTLPLLLTQVNLGRLSLAEVSRLMSEKPAEIFGLEDRGRLLKGNRADLTVVDLHRKFKIVASEFRSKARFSPFDGWHVKGKPVKTFVGGQLIMDEEEIMCKAGSGEIIRRK